MGMGRKSDRTQRAEAAKPPVGPTAGGSGRTPWLLEYADFDYSAFMRRRNVRRLVAFIIVLIALIFCFSLQAIFLPLAVALLTAYVLNPIVVAIEKRGASRQRAVVTVFLIFIGVTGLLLALLIPPAIRNVGDFLDFIQDPTRVDGTLYNLAMKWNESAPEGMHIDETSVGLKTFIESIFGGGAVQAAGEAATDTPVATTVAASALDVAGKVFGTLISLALFVVLVPLYTFYFLLELDGIWNKIKSYLPGTQRERWLRILGEIHVMVSAFFRGRLTICAIVAVATIIAFLILGVPYAVFLGLLGGFGVIIPFFSMVASMLPAALLMLGSGSSTTAIVIMIVVFLAIQAVEQYVLTPKILGKAVELHPVTLLVGVFVMASLFGIVGALLAVPLTAIAKILGREFVLPYFRQIAEEREATDEAIRSGRIGPKASAPPASPSAEAAGDSE